VNLNDPVSCASTFRSNRNLGLVFWAFIVGAGLLGGSKQKKMQEDSDSTAVASV